MTLQYLELELLDGGNYYSLFLHYLVEEEDKITRNADKLVEIRSQSSMIIYLVNLIQNNLDMILDFKVDIGNYREYDMIVDTWKFLTDIELLVDQIDHVMSSKAIQYIECYKELILTIVKIENNEVQIPGSLKNYKAFMVQSFREYAFDLYIGQSLEEFACLEVGDNHSDDFNLFFSQGKPMIFCGDHSTIQRNT